MFSFSAFLQKFRLNSGYTKRLEQSLLEAKTTIQQLQQQAFAHTDARYLESLISNLNTGVLLEDEHRKLLVINKRFGQFFKLDIDPVQLVGQDCSTFALQVKDQFEYPDFFIQSIDECLKNRQPVLDVELRKKDGKILLRDYIPIFNQGIYKGHLWHYTDVTEERKFTSTLQQSEEKYRGIMENMDLGLMEVDNHNNIVKVYDRFATLLGYEKDELLGKNALDTLISPEYLPELQKRTKDRLEGKSNAYEIQLRKKNGEQIWVLVSGAPIINSDGVVTGSIGIHYDISAQKKLMLDLEQAKNEAEKARMAEVQFLANMSHEIRNPINAIAGITNLMYDTPVNKEQLEYLDTLKFSSDVLMSLISDILDINKIESGGMEINEREINLTQLLKAIANTSRFNRRDQKVEILEKIDPKINFHVIADQTMVNQILLNLVGNAIKFTKEGLVKIKIDLQSESDEDCTILFTISDTGIGIDPTEIEHIFENFKQAGPQIKEKFGGTGLGLAITKRLVEMMNGTIWVKSIVGQGADFYVSIPMRKGSKISINPEKIKHIKSEIGHSIKEVLIVEDNVVNQNYLKGVLKKQRISYKIANNGKEAIELTDKYAFDLILMDIRMPEMNGYDATVWIRSQTENSNAQVPIIALTASALVDERKKALQVGMNEHLSKPFTESMLIETINRVFGEKYLDEQELNNASKVEFILSGHFDKDLLSDYYLNDLQHLYVVFEHFLSSILSDLALIQQNIIERNFKEIGRILHKIKPNFSFVGFPELGQNASNFELQCQDVNFSDKEALVENISILLSEMMDCVEKVKLEHKRLEKHLQK